MSNIHTVAAAKPTSEDVRALRLRTLRTIAELAERHDLPVPEDIRTNTCDFSSGSGTGLSIDLTFAHDDITAVDRWATVLDLPAPVATSYPIKGSDDERMMQHEYTSRLWTFPEPCWLGWTSVDLTTYLSAAAGSTA